MGQVAIGGEEVRGSSVFDLPKLDPSFKDERARCFIPDPNEVFMNFRHSIGGQRAMPKGAPPGTPVPGWGGNWICNGRYEVLRDSNPHADPEACILCKLHKDGDPLVDKATRKWVMQVFRYATDPTGQMLQQPFSVALRVWAFNDREFGQLSEIKKAWGDLRSFDLMLTCISKDFKTWDVGILPQALWTTQPDWIRYVQEAYQAQHVGGDLESIIGRKATNDNEILGKLMEIRQPQGPFGGAPQYPGQMQQPQQPYYPGQQMPQVPGQPYGAPPTPQIPDLPAPPPLAQAMQQPPQQYAQPVPQQLPPQAPPPQFPPSAAAVPGIPATAPGLPAPPPLAAPSQLAGQVPGQYAPPAQQQFPLTPEAPQQQLQPPQMPAQQPQAPIPPMAPPGPPAAPQDAPQPIDFASLLNVPPAAPPQ